jgi:putative oxidoreductase
MDIALLIVRLIIGLGFAAHGAQKLFGWFGGYGIAGTGGFFAGLGFQPGTAFAALAGLSEFGGGLLVALGLGGPIGPALMLIVMAVATITVHLKNGWFVTKNGFELPFAYGGLAVLFAFYGYGSYSLDAALGFSALSSERDATIAVIAGLVIGVLTTLLRRPQPAKA